MLKRLFPEKLERLPRAVLYVLVFITAILISYLHPNTTPFRYQFEKGQAWRYADLLSPIDYAVEKPVAEIKREINRVKLNSPDYYQYQPNVETDLIKHFSDQFHQACALPNKADKLPEAILRDSVRYLNYGKSVLHRIYEVGILQINDSSAHNGYGIHVLRNNVSEEHAVDLYPDWDKAAIVLRDSLMQSKLPNAVAQIGRASCRERV